MKPEVKKAWVKALRSGKYRKGKEYLRRQEGKHDRYCCLGVLCDVNGVRWHRKWYDSLEYSVSGDCGNLTPRRLRQFGLTDVVQKALIKANDERDWSFNRIATWIEKNL